MATIKLLPHGVSGGFSPPPGSARPGKRGEIKGWSQSAARRNVRFLQSVNVELLDGAGYAVTHTLAETPATADAWESLRDNYLQRLRRAGMVRYHWVTEWTKRGRPHMHAVLYFESFGLSRVAAILEAWLSVADSMGFVASTRGQDIKPVDGLVGWMQYLSKHASRGVTHYQHQGAPEGWDKTGRLWGKGGDWPVEEVEELELGQAQFLYFRRRVWDWMLQDMVDRGVDDEYVLAVAEKWANPEHGNHHGISGWIPAAVCYAIYLEAKSAELHDHVWEN